MSRSTSWGQRLYELLLRCYPAAFRDEYGREMRAAFDRLWREEQARGRAALAGLSLSVLVDTLATAVREHLSILSQDIRVSGRALLKTPAFTVAGVATLALGIGFATATFSVVHAVLLRPLPFPDPNELVELVETKPLEAISAYDTSWPNFVSWRERTQSFTSMAALWNSSFNLADEGEPERVEGVAASVSLWSVLGLNVVAGRTFAPDDVSSGQRVAVFSEGLFRRRYGADLRIIGKTVRLNGIPYTIVGVVPGDMGFTRDVDVWVPFLPNLQWPRGDRQLTVLARLRPGVSVSEASAELEGLAAALAREFPASNQGYSARARPLLDLAVSPAVDRALKILMAAVGLLLLVACANVANLVLTRAIERRGELALRRALGAGNARLTRQVATESLVLAAAGGASGVLLAYVVVRAARPALASMLPRAWSLSLDLPVLVTALAMTVVTGLLFALIPAWRAMRHDVTDALRMTGRVLSDRSSAKLQQTFVVGQFCLATMLVIGAALLTHSLMRLMRVDPGFKTDHLLMTTINLSSGSYPTQESRGAFYRRLTEAVSAIPGVASVGFVSRTPVRPGGGTGMEIGTTQASIGSPLARRAHWRIATPAYFGTLGVRLLRGRLFEIDEPDTRGGFRPVILSEALVRRLWPGGDDPIGRRVWLANGQMRTVIGVVSDVHQTGLADGRTPTMYMPTSWVFLSTMTLVVRTTGEPGSMAPAVRQAVRRLDPQQPVFEVHTMDAQVRASAAQSRLTASLLGAFALLALVLGAVGVAGVVSYAVARRQSELAMRMALGAQASRVMREVAAHGIRLCFYGLATGLAGALALRHALSSLLFAVRSDDLTTFATVAMTLAAVALMACWLPASRVTRIDPATVLRGE